MKKIILSAILAAAVISCDKAGRGSSVNKLENEDQKAGYAYGVYVGQDVERYSQSLREDSLNYNELEKGIWDYLNSSNKDRISYAQGQSIGMSIDNFLKTQKLEGKVDQKYIVAGIMNVLKKDSLLFSKDSVMPYIQTYMQKNHERIMAENLEKGNKFLEEKKKSSKVKETESGLLYEVIEEGNGEQPAENSIVKVNYIGKLVDGKVFDESEKDKPAEFSLMSVIPGWREGLQLMKTGGKYKFYIPANLAYGMNGAPGGSIGPNEVLEFEVELLEVKDGPDASSQLQLTPEQIQQMMQQQQGN